MLTYNPEKRISASQALRRRFVKKNVEGSDLTDGDLMISVNNLKNLKAQTKFQKAVLTFCASQQLSQKAEAKIRKSFEILDTNKDGKLSTEELIIGYTNICGDAKKAKKEVERMMKNMDLNQCGEIEYNGKEHRIVNIFRISYC